MIRDHPEIRCIVICVCFFFYRDSENSENSENSDHSIRPNKKRMCFRTSFLLHSFRRKEVVGLFHDLGATYDVDTLSKALKCLVGGNSLADYYATKGVNVY